MLDLTPTLLALLDLPVASDMPGSVRTALLPDGLSLQEPVASYGEGRPAGDGEFESPGEEDYLERLRALGYIQ